MIDVAKEMRGMKSRLIMQVHDELVVDAAVSELDEVKALLVRCMERAVKLDVPLEVEVSHGQNWLGGSLTFTLAWYTSRRAELFCPKSRMHLKQPQFRINPNRMKKLRNSLFLSLAASALVLASCGGPTGPTTSGDALTEGASVSQRTKRLKKIFRAAPTPMETARLVQKTGATFSADHLHSAMAASNYVTSDRQAINLGVYGADLSYATIFEENAVSLTYLEVVKSLARELGVGDVIGDDMLARAEANRARQDSLVAIVSEAFFNLNEKLKSNGQEDLSGMLVAAGWVESLYLATRHADKANEALRQRIAEQKLVMEDVMDLVTSYQQSPELQGVVEVLQPVVAAFDAVTKEEAKNEISKSGGAIVIGGGPRYTASEEVLAQITDAVTTARNQLVK